MAPTKMAIPDAASNPPINNRQSQPCRNNSMNAPMHTAGASNSEIAAVKPTMLRPIESLDQSQRIRSTPQDNPRNEKAANVTNCQGLTARRKKATRRIGEMFEIIVLFMFFNSEQTAWLAACPV
jgi:hypothetical protein